MSIETAIENAQQKVANVYTKINNLGGTLPATQNLSNIPDTLQDFADDIEAQLRNLRGGNAL